MVVARYTGFNPPRGKKLDITAEQRACALAELQREIERIGQEQLLVLKVHHHHDIERQRHEIGKRH